MLLTMLLSLAVGACFFFVDGLAVFAVFVSCCCCLVWLLVLLLLLLVLLLLLMLLLFVGGVVVVFCSFC